MASIIKVDTIQSTTSNVFFQNSAGTEYARFDSTGVFQLANPTSLPAGTAAAPSITATGDTNTGLYFPAADTIAFTEGGVESMRIDSTGNMGIGTTTPLAKLHVNTTSAAAYIGYGANFDNYFQTNNNTYFTNYNGSVEHARITSTGLLQFNSGFGSVATAYGCRAWVNFNGTGTVAIRASGNVTSITDNGTGDYTVNFTTAMSDVNYCVNLTGSIQGTTSTNGGFIATLSRNTTPAVGSVRTEMFTSTFANADPLQVNVAIFR